MSAEERQKEYETRWAAGGTSFIAAYNDLIIDKARNGETGAVRVAWHAERTLFADFQPGFYSHGVAA